MSEFRMTYPRAAQTDFPVSDLLARIRELESELAEARAKIAAPAAPKPAKPGKGQRSPTDYRTAAELWLAGEAVEVPPKVGTKATRQGTARAVRVTFTDGTALRLSTYQEGPQGIAAAVRTARTILQSKADRDCKPWENSDWYRTGTWCRDARGAWRLVDVAPCPDLVSAEFVA